MIAQNINIMSYSPEYKSRLIQFLGYMWNDLNKTERQQRFEWRYEKNPYIEKPQIILALFNNEIIALRAFVVQIFVIQLKQITVFSPADAIVHPDYRRLGLFKKMNDVFINSISQKYSPYECLVLNLSSNRHSTLACLKQGWQETDGLKKYGYKLSGLNYLKVIFFRGGIKYTSDYSIQKNNLVIEVSSSLRHGELSKLIEDNRNNDRISNIRDEAYFKWRYSRNSEEYIFVYCREDSKLIGYMICKKYSKYQAILEEYFAANEKALHLMLKSVTKKMSIPVLRTLVLSKVQKELLKKCGFLVESKIVLNILNKKRLPVLVRPNQINPSDSDFVTNGIDIRNIENWDLFQADSH